MNHTTMNREEAIEIVRKLYHDSLFLKKDKEAIETLIPELKESEDEIPSNIFTCKSKDKQLWLLIDSIDHAYLQTDGTYSDLALEVVDKVRYLKDQLYSEQHYE